jgi:hypothetical protein
MLVGDDSNKAKVWESRRDSVSVGSYKLKFGVMESCYNLLLQYPLTNQQGNVAIRICSYCWHRNDSTHPLLYLQHFTNNFKSRFHCLVCGVMFFGKC